MTTSPSSNQNAFARLALAAAFAAAAPLALVAPRAYAERQRGSQSERRDDDNKGDRDKRDGRSRGHRDGGREDWGVGPFGPTWGGRGEQRPVSAPEWAEVSMFMQRFSPFRMGEVQRMPEGEWKERIKRGLAYRH